MWSEIYVFWGNMSHGCACTYMITDEIFDMMTEHVKCSIIYDIFYMATEHVKGSIIDDIFYMMTEHVKCSIIN
jgi:hypothetical protein